VRFEEVSKFELPESQESLPNRDQKDSREFLVQRPERDRIGTRVVGSRDPTDPGPGLQPGDLTVGGTIAVAV
jgi:hypothetical protein